MYQQSAKFEYMYNNQGGQQKQTEEQTVNSENRRSNPSQNQSSLQTNRQFFMQGGSNQTIKDHQKPKIFDLQNQNQTIKNGQIISRFPFQIPNSPQYDHSNIIKQDGLSQFDVTNWNKKSEFTYDNQSNNQYYQNQGKIIKTEEKQKKNATVSNKQELFNNQQKFLNNELQSIQQKQMNNSSLEQNKCITDQQQKFIANTLYDQLVKQKEQCQDVQIKNKVEPQQKVEQNQDQFLSIIQTESNLMELQRRENSTMKILERKLGIRNFENFKESPIKQNIEVEVIKSESINSIIQPEINQKQKETNKQQIQDLEQQFCDVLNEPIMEVIKFNDDEDTNMEEPVKVSNFVTTKIQLKGEKQLQQFNQVSQPSQRCSALEFETLEKMNQVRLNRLDRMKIDFFGSVERLEKSDCISDLVADKQIIQLIITQFPYLRRVRGDGNCLFSSLLFPYLELIYINNLFDSVLNQFVAHEIYWNKVTMIDRPMVFTLIKKIFQELKKLAKKCNNDMMLFSEVILHYINKVNGFYDILIIFMRSTIIQSFKLYSQQGEYQYFLDEKSSEEFIERNSSFEEEGDFLSIQFFCEITQLKVKLINFSDKHPIQSMQTLEPKINKARTDQHNFISLKYNEGHYDVLYSRMFKQIQIKEEERLLPQLQFTPLY